MILILSHPQDPHAGRVMEALRRSGQEPLLLDLSLLPRGGQLALRYSPGREVDLCLRLAGENPVDLAQVQSVWWRRPQVPDLAEVADAELHIFTANEWNEALQGLWQLISCPWMNPPQADEVAGRKALQLKLAAELGLRIPRTLITNDPQQAREFIHEVGLGRCIFKSFSCTHTIWRETRLVRETELELLEHVQLAPVIFQEYIDGDVDYRVTVVGSKLFPAAIHAGGTDYPTDFRMSLGQARTESAELPAEVTARLRALMERLGLVYGAIDLRQSRSGEFVFFEVNTAGEFLFIEERTGQPIARAVADWLIRPVAERRALAGHPRPGPGTTARLPGHPG